MNFKNLLYLFAFIFLLGCGVKSDPIPPDGSILPSYPDEFVQQDEVTKKNKKKK